VDLSYEYDFILAGNVNIINLNGSIHYLIIKGGGIKVKFNAYMWKNNGERYK